MTVVPHGLLVISFGHTGFIEQAGVKTGPNGVSVLRALLDYANQDSRECFPNIATICARTALSESTVQRTLRSLSDAGFITVNKRFAGNGRQTSNSYTILDGKLVIGKVRREMLRIIKSPNTPPSSANSENWKPAGEGVTERPLEQNVIESKAKGVKATPTSTSTALGLDSGFQPSSKPRHEPAADAGGSMRSGAGSTNGQGTAKPKPKPKPGYRHTPSGGLWIPWTGTQEELVVFQGRTANGVQATTTATTKPTTTATSKAQATSTAGSPTPPKPPPPRVAAEPLLAGAEPRSAADPSLGRGNAAKGPQQPRKRAPRESDPFFRLFGELVLGGDPTSRTRGLAGEFASRCVKNGVSERAVRDWYADLERTGELKFLRSNHAWEMLFRWWAKRKGKYVQHPSGQSELERSLGAGQGEKWAHLRYGVPRE